MPWRCSRAIYIGVGRREAAVNASARAAKGSQTRVQEEGMQAGSSSTSASSDTDAQKGSRLITSLIVTDAHKPAARGMPGLGSPSMACRAC
jgi:hypothetical protein